MSLDFSKVKAGRLKLKGGKKVGGTSSKECTSSDDTTERKRKIEDTDARSPEAIDEDNHGGWWCIQSEAEVKAGAVAIETTPHVYVKALDDGRFSLGAPHECGEPPAPDEIFTLLKTPDSNLIAFKSGYGKYLSVSVKGFLEARAEAVGMREKWELIFDEGKMAIQASNNHFLSYEPDSEGYVLANVKTAKETEYLKLRTNNEREKPIDWTPAEDKKTLRECEKAYIANFQNLSKDYHKIKPLDKDTLKRAKYEGTLHETMLDRRQKTKADRYCK